MAHSTKARYRLGAGEVTEPIITYLLYEKCVDVHDSEGGEGSSILLLGLPSTRSRRLELRDPSPRALLASFLSGCLSFSKDGYPFF